MKKILITVFVFLSITIYSEPRMNFYTDKEFQLEQEEIFDMYLSYPISKDQTMLNVLRFFYKHADTLDRWFVLNDKTNTMVLSFCFTRYSAETASSVSLILTYPYNDKYKDLDYVIKNAEFTGVFAFDTDTKEFKGEELKKQLIKLISDTDEDVEISPQLP